MTVLGVILLMAGCGIALVKLWDTLADWWCDTRRHTRRWK